MKTSDIVAQLQAELPKHDSRFTDALSVTSATAVGTTVTIVTTTPHGRTTGDAVTISGSRIGNSVSLVAVDTTVTGTTSFDHDLTRHPTDIDTQIVISGAADSLFNGVFLLTSVDNRREFTYELPSIPGGPAGGAPILEEDRIDGFGGRFSVTVTDTTTFTYEVDTDPAGPSTLADMAIHTKPKISRAITLERAVQAYTKQATSVLWLFVVPGNTDVSNDRRQLNDTVASFMEGTDRRIHTIVNFDIVVMFPTSGEIAASNARDDAEDIAAALYKSLAGFKAPTSLVDETQFLITPIGHGFGLYTGPVYAHLFRWQVIEDVTEGDTFIAGTRAFRDIRFLIDNTFEEPIIDTGISLDDKPLT